jgi:hypothetical protein
MVWGEGSELKITIGRADFWDHRGGMPWTEKQNYKDIRRCLDEGDAKGIKNIFACSTENIPGQPSRPSVLPVGRLDLAMDKSFVLKRGKIDLDSGSAEIICAKGCEEHKIKIHLSMEDQSFAMEFPEEAISLKPVPAWEYQGEYLSEISFEPPLMLDKDGLKGWVQKLPADPALCIGCKVDGKKLWVVSERDEDVKNLICVSGDKLSSASDSGIDALETANRKWWSGYWEDIPEINIPNEDLEFVYLLGLYKFAGFTNPNGIPATLQGPWIEEYRMPPWSSDYHFNINVQMCYWPAYKANRLTHLRPLFDMVWSWREKLRANAKAFIGVDDAYMLPHAVDDRCICMGGFWTGTIDHACSAWIAQMMRLYYKYTGDIEFLRETAFPFMKGVMRVYEEMLEKRNENYFLPVSVSPEYRGADMDAWGENASFQLAAIHRLCEDLIESAGELGEKPSAVWSEILKKLPKAMLGGSEDEEKIVLWEGVDLEESHRHHSHLAAICPFDSIDIYSDEWAPRIARTINHWIEKGTGLWSGWSVPWASMIHSRLGNGEAAEMLVENWKIFYTNKGHGSLHDCSAAGFSTMGAPSFKGLVPNRGEIMQMDGAMGAVVAVQDMLMHSRRGVVYLFPGAPESWKKLYFKKMPCEGGFLISAFRENGKVGEVSIKSVRKGVLKLGNPWNCNPVAISSGEGATIIAQGETLEIEFKENSICTIRPEA